MSAIELANLCYLFEKFSKSVDMDEAVATLYGKMFDQGVAACNGEQQFYQMIEVQKLGD